LNRDFKPDIYLSIAKSYVLFGDTEKAEQFLETLVRDYPRLKGGHLMLAEAQAKAGNYDQAYQSLRKEIEVDPILEEDVRTRVALALGGTLQEPKNMEAIAEAFLRANVQVEHLLDSLHTELWPQYRELGPDARRKWLTAVCVMHYFPPMAPQQRQTLLEESAGAFCKAIEIELRARIFDAYKRETQKNPTLRNHVKESLSSVGAEPFCKYLLAQCPLTLGEMVKILSLSRAPCVPVFRDFDAWLTQSFPYVRKTISVFEEIRRIRNLSTHGSVPTEEALRVPKLCREALNVLLGVRK
jgi:tetratricopeptide (TPR) repeat protein